MANPFTKQLLLADKRYCTGFLGFDKRLKVIPDWSQVIFRGDRYYGHMDALGIPIKVRTGDIAVLIYQFPRLYSLTGTVSTKDNYKRIYDVPLELRVRGLIATATEYFQEKDPADQAIRHVKERFERDAYRYNHDDFQRMSIGWSFERWSEEIIKETGIIIKQSSKAMFRQDPRHTELNRLRAESILKEEQEKRRHQQEILQKQHTFEMERLANAFQREEGIKDEIHKFRTDLLATTKKELNEFFIERAKESFEKGNSSSEIMTELLTMLHTIGDYDQYILFENKITQRIIDNPNKANSGANNGQIKTPPVTPSP